MDVGAIQDLLDLLVTWEANVNAQYPDDCSWPAEDYAPQEHIQDPPFAVWKAAQVVFNVLSSSQDCICDPAHDYGARLRLGTYRKPNSDDDDDNEDEVSFDMFLSAMQDWQEVRVHSARERAIQFAVMEAEATTAKAVSKRAKNIQRLNIQCLCEPIFNMKKRSAYRLELQVKKGQLFKLQSERSDQLIDLNKTPVSLDQFLQGGPQSFTEKTKRILMVLLSYAVLHLHDTPWLQSTWNSSNVIFFRNRGSQTPLRPFLDEYENDDVDPDDMMQHPCPTMVPLALMLMEIFFVALFDELARRFNVKITGEMPGLFQYLDVDMVFNSCKSEIPENSHFLNVIDKCLDPTTWKDEDDATLDYQALRTVIYEEVVRPLENDLRQAYSSISIQDLDQFAQTLDMNLKFFDDEAVSGNQSGQYAYWKAKYLAVYNKFITPYAFERAPNRVKIAVLDTGIDLNHPEIQACDENIRDKRNFLADGSKGTGDSQGHGTFAIRHAVDVWKVDMISMSFGYPKRDIPGYTELEAALKHADFRDGVKSAWSEHLCNGDAVAIKSGTSFATPIMVGVAALLVTYIRLHIPDRAEAVKQRSMENLLRKVAQKGPDGEERDGYWFVDLSLFNDSLFGKEKEFIDSTIRDILND
ncbi:hypothetical protein F5883DRAFT_696801 [Diaporthe sp. PMI_573]|nr:hypothetical protein F5883DRAFT_696801 [Diaporthaceae sp. PMI_573]